MFYITDSSSHDDSLGDNRSTIGSVLVEHQRVYWVPNYIILCQFIDDELRQTHPSILNQGTCHGPTVTRLHLGTIIEGVSQFLLVPIANNRVGKWMLAMKWCNWVLMVLLLLTPFTSLSSEKSQVPIYCRIDRSISRKPLLCFNPGIFSPVRVV